MGTSKYIIQPIGVGERMDLNEQAKDHIAFLLRAIQRLPILSDIDALETNISHESLVRWLHCIHQNHLELAALATTALVVPYAEVAIAPRNNNEFESTVRSL